MKSPARETHNIPPVFDSESRILILGSFPSVKSREEGFFYGHRQNRFWAVVSRILGVPKPETIEEKRDMLISHHIALWDVIESCDIAGSADSKIRNAVPNDISRITRAADIRHIYLNGGEAFKMFERYNGDIGLPYSRLPSTSPANAAYSVERLAREWEVIREFL
ncbi:MAG: DNA-deoxyinosine glycosylase [Clostridia bacterium]|nr:DNA-deoxyinosine glycosylase [Clostridia bacterium]